MRLFAVTTELLASVQQPEEIYSDIKITPSLPLTHKPEPREQTDVMWTQSLESTRGSIGNRISGKDTRQESSETKKAG